MHWHLWQLIVIFSVVAGTGAGQTAPKEPAIPETFGLATITYTRKGSNSEFEGFMTRFALMDCPIITEINVVWNNEKTPEQMGILKDKANWKRPVNFYLTPYNSLHWRYRIPKESSARVFFVLDDEVIYSCSSLTKGFRLWQSHAVGQIGPLVTFYPKTFNFNDSIGFDYRFTMNEYFTLGVLGFASRHFFELFQSDLWIMEEVRKVVAERNNCEDIALNFITDYFYPEMLTVIYRGEKGSMHPKAGVSKSPEHQKKRSDCLRLFSNIFGVNPLRYKPKVQSYPGKDRGFPFRNETVWARRTYLEREVIHKGALENLQGDVGSLWEVSPFKEQQEDGKGQGKQAMVGTLEKQLADALRREAKLSMEYRELKKKLQKDYTPMGGSVGTSLKPTDDSNQDDAPFSQWSYNAVIYGGVVLICLALLLCLWRQVQTSRQLAAIKTMKINMPKQQDFARETDRGIQKQSFDSV